MRIWLIALAVMLSGCETVTGSVTSAPAPTVASPSPTPWVYDPSKVTYVYPSTTPVPGPPTSTNNCSLHPAVTVGLAGQVYRRQQSTWVSEMVAVRAMVGVNDQDTIHRRFSAMVDEDLVYANALYPFSEPDVKALFLKTTWVATTEMAVVSHSDMGDPGMKRWLDQWSAAWNDRDCASQQLRVDLGAN